MKKVGFYVWIVISFALIVIAATNFVESFSTFVETHHHTEVFSYFKELIPLMFKHCFIIAMNVLIFALTLSYESEVTAD